MKYSKDTVRKNVTISKELSENLEQASWCTGVSQSAIIDAAFKEPSMKRLFAFCCCEDDGDCMVDLLDMQGSLLDAYVDGYATGRAIIGVLIGDYLPVVVMRQDLDSSAIREFHDYARSHMPGNCVNSSRSMQAFYEEFENGTFYCSDVNKFKSKIEQFMREVYSSHDFLVESYFYRILAYIFERLTMVPGNMKDDTMKSMFSKLCDDRRVFGVMPQWA